MRTACALLCLVLAVPALAQSGAAPRLDAPVYGTIRPVPLTLTGEGFGTPGPGSKLVVDFGDAVVTLPSRSPRILVWQDHRIVVAVGEDARSGIVRVRTPGGLSEAARADLFDYDWFDIPPTPGTNAAPLSIAVGDDGQVWVNQEFHRDFQHLDPATGVVTGLPIPKPPGPGPFASTIFSDHRTQTSVLGESILVDPEGHVWFSQGGGSLYSGVHPNHSRVVRYDPAAPEGDRYRVYNMPGDQNEIVGLAWDEARGRMWVAQGGFESTGGHLLASFDPERIPWDNDFDFSTSLAQQVCRPGEPEDACYRLYHLPDASLRPAHLEVTADGTVWYTAYWGNLIGSLDPATGEVIEYPLPPHIGTSPPSPFVRSGPWEITEAANGDLVFAEFFDSTISRFDASRRLDPACRQLDDDDRNPCITSFVVPDVDLATQQVHSVAFDLEGRLWFGQHIERGSTDASLGFITANGQHILLLPSLGLFPGNAEPTADGVAVDPTTGDIYFCEFWRKRIGRLHRLTGPPSAAIAETSARVDQAGASRLTLSAYPNPARGRVTIEAHVGETGPATVAVYDALGRRVAVLHDGTATGSLSLPLDTSTLLPGVYVVRATGAGTAAVTRVVVLK